MSISPSFTQMELPAMHFIERNHFIVFSLSTEPLLSAISPTVNRLAGLLDTQVQQPAACQCHDVRGNEINIW